MNAIVLLEAGSFSKEMKRKDWQKPPAAFQHLRLHGKKKTSAANSERKNWPGVAALEKFADSSRSSCGVWMALVCFGLFWFVSSQPSLTLAVFSAWNVLLLTKESWGEGKSWAHKGSCAFLRQISGLGNALGWGRTCPCFHVLWGWGDGMLWRKGPLYAQRGQSKAKGNSWCRITASSFLELFVSSIHALAKQVSSITHCFIERDKEAWEYTEQCTRNFCQQQTLCFPWPILSPAPKLQLILRAKKPQRAELWAASKASRCHSNENCFCCSLQACQQQYPALCVCQE